MKFLILYLFISLNVYSNVSCEFEFTKEEKIVLEMLRSLEDTRMAFMRRKQFGREEHFIVVGFQQLTKNLFKPVHMPC